MKVYRDGNVWAALRSINDEIRNYWRGEYEGGIEDEVYIENLLLARTALRKVLLDQNRDQEKAFYYNLNGVVE